VWSPARLAFAPESSLATLAFVLAGVALGTCSGLVPGLHANNVALLLAAVAPTLPGPPRLVGAAIVAAGVTHTFLDVVPTLALGVPDPAMAASALPGHRLVLEGRGREALRLSALGSASAVLLAVPLAVPVTELMVAAWPTVRANLPLVLAAVVGFLLVTEGGVRGALGGAVAVALSGALGLVALPLSPAAPLPGSVLAPLFAGLFGAPVLLDAMRGTGVPRQAGTAIALERRTLAGLGATGSLAGAVVGYVPGVSSAIAATVALSATPGRYGARGFLVTTSGVNTSNAVFALFALVALGSPRTGVLVAFEETGAPLDLPLLLGSVALAAVAGFLLVLAVGDRYLDRVGRVDPRWLSLAVLGLLAVLSGAFAGVVGLVLFAVATLVGLVPARLGVRRAHLMGVLVVPLALP
jgi:putative membrane protein